MKKIIISLLAMAIVIGLHLAACAAGHKLGCHPALIRLQGATEVAYDVYKGRERLMYTLNEKFPASRSLDRIKYKLKEMGWQSLDDNYFMPGVPTSHVTG